MESKASPTVVFPRVKVKPWSDRERVYEQELQILLSALRQLPLAGTHRPFVHRGDPPFSHPDDPDYLDYVREVAAQVAEWHAQTDD